MKTQTLLAFALAALSLASQSFAAEPRWWKGNLHTHSFWSDGDDYPEMIVDWYKKNGYHFLSLSDHNVLLEGQRWILTGTNRGGGKAFEKYLARFGPSWVETRERTNGIPEARLKPLAEFKPLFEEPGRFLLIPSEEITDRYKIFPVHMNATNLRMPIKPQGGTSVLEVMRRNVSALRQQREETGQPMFMHLNHPNFHWGVTAEDLAHVEDEKFFEVYNGHPAVYNEGDAIHPGTDRIWDVAITLRIAHNIPKPLYGIGVDDSHNYHKFAPNESNSGRGWVMVRAAHLTPESIVNAMEAGDFYASSGVELLDVLPSKTNLALRIKPENGVTYLTEFIGVRRGYDTNNLPVMDAAGNALPITRRYSSQVGETLAAVEGDSPSYAFQGNELYVRARVTSSRLKSNPIMTNEFERAWVQPVMLAQPPR